MMRKTYIFMISLGIAACIVSCSDDSSYKPLGEACQTDGNCLSGKCDMDICILPDDSGTHKKANGDTCQNANECASHACSSNICEAASPSRTNLQNGEICENDDQCISKFCDRQICRAEDTQKLPNGSACSDNAQCQSNACVNKVCQNAAGSEKLPNGAACSNNAQCQSNACVNKVCQNAAASEKLPNGAACSDNAQCQSHACVNKLCQNGSTESPKRPDGSTCTADTQCLGGSCIDHRCLTDGAPDLSGIKGTEKTQNGEKCSDDLQCASGRCTDRICQSAGASALANGAACTDDAQCASNACVSQKCVKNQSETWCDTECQPPYFCDGGRCMDYTSVLCTRAGQCASPGVPFYYECPESHPVYDEIRDGFSKCFTAEHLQLNSDAAAADKNYRDPIIRYYPTKTAASIEPQMNKYSSEDSKCMNTCYTSLTDCGTVSACSAYIYKMSMEVTSCGQSVREYTRCMKDVTCEDLKLLAIGSGGKCAAERAAYINHCSTYNKCEGFSNY